MSILRETLPKSARQRALAVSKLAYEHKADRIRLFEVSQHCDYADYFVVFNGNSTRQVQALAKIITDCAEENISMEGYQIGQWVLMDLGDVIVHIFHRDAREHYNFDKLWAHVPSSEMEKDEETLDPIAQGAYS